MDTKLSQEVNFTSQFLKFEDIFYAIRFENLSQEVLNLGTSICKFS